VFHFDILLVYIFYYLFNALRFVRIGSVVLALHDATDVFLEIGKMSIYSGAESIASFAFILFVLSWTILRIIYYPFWVLRSTRFVLNPFPIYILFSFCHLLKFIFQKRMISLFPIHILKKRPLGISTLFFQNYVQN